MWRDDRGRHGLGHTASWFEGQNGGGFLHVTEGDAGVEGSGDEGVAKGVGSDRWRSRPARDVADDAGGGVTVESGAV